MSKHGPVEPGRDLFGQLWILKICPENPPQTKWSNHEGGAYLWGAIHPMRFDSPTFSRIDTEERTTVKCVDNCVCRGSVDS